MNFNLEASALIVEAFQDTASEAISSLQSHNFCNYEKPVPMDISALLMLGTPCYSRGTTCNR